MRARCPGCHEVFLIRSEDLIRPEEGNGAAVASDSDQETGAAGAADDTRDSIQTYVLPTGDRPSDAAFGSAAAEREPGRQTFPDIGRYRTVRVLGAGGFGVVYQARDPELGRDVAIKLPRFARGSDTAERFRKEARAVAGLRHPNIVAVFDHGETQEGVFIVYEFVPGRTLEQAMGEQRFDRSRSIECVATLADALAYAASEGIVHRDIKPANVMIDPRDRPQIMDFGLAEALSGGKASTGGHVAGTPAYMSPEQARGESHLGPESDQYSLAAVLYEMLTGTRPIRNRGKAAIVEVADRLTPPLEPLSRVPKDLRAICLKAMSRDPDARYADCREFAADLRRFLQGVPVAARPVGITTRLRMWSGRNRGTAAATGIAAIMLIAVALVSSVAAVALRQGKRDVLLALADAENAKLEAERNAGEAVQQRQLAEQSAEREKTAREEAEAAREEAVELLGKYRAAEEAREKAETEAIEIAQARDQVITAFDATRDRLTTSEEENRLFKYAEMLAEANTAIQNQSLSAARRLLDGCDPNRRGWEWEWLRRRATGGVSPVRSFELVTGRASPPEVLRRVQVNRLLPCYDVAIMGPRSVATDPTRVRFAYHPDLASAVRLVPRPNPQGGDSWSLRLLDFRQEKQADIDDFVVSQPVSIRFLEDGVHLAVIREIPGPEALADTATTAFRTDVWNMRTGRTLLQITTRAFLPSLVAYPTDGYLIGCTDVSELTTWRLADGQEVIRAEVPFAIRSGPDALRKAPAGSVDLIAVDQDYRFHYIDPLTPAVRSTRPPTRPIPPDLDLCWTSDSRFVAAFPTEHYQGNHPSELGRGKWLLFDAEDGAIVGQFDSPVTGVGKSPTIDETTPTREKYHRRDLEIDRLDVTDRLIAIRDSGGGIWHWADSEPKDESEYDPSIDLAPFQFDHPVHIGVANANAVAFAGERSVSILRDDSTSPTRLRPSMRSGIRSVAVDKAGQSLAAADELGYLWVWDLRDRKRIRELRHPGITTLRFLNAGNQLIVGDETGGISNYRVDTGEITLSIPNAHAGKVTAMAVSKTADIAVTTGDNRRLCCWDTTTGQRLNRQEYHLPEPVHLIAMHDPGHIACVGLTRLFLFDLDRQSGFVSRGTAPLPRQPQRLVYGPGGRRLFAARDNQMTVFDASTGGLLLELPPTRDRICHIFHDTQDTVTAILADGSIQKWLAGR